MNAGIYGITDGRGMAGRKLIGLAGRSVAPSSGAQYVSSSALALGASVNIASLVSGVRQRILSISGSGALRFLSIADSGTSSPAYVAELFIDGVQVLRSQWSHSATGGQGPILIGGVPTGVGPVLDYLPFSASLDVYVTATGTISGPYFAYLADIHQ